MATEESDASDMTMAGMTMPESAGDSLRINQWFPQFHKKCPLMQHSWRWAHASVNRALKLRE